MSKKNLLNESTIRKFMKLASLQPLASDFLGRIQESDEELEENKEELEENKEELEEATEETVEETVEEEVELDEMGDHAVYQDDADLEAPAEEEAEEIVADEGGDARLVDLDDFVQALEDAIAKVTGEPTEVEYEEDPELDLDAADADLGLDAVGADLGLDAAEEEEEEEEEDLAESIYKAVLKKIGAQKK